MKVKEKIDTQLPLIIQSNALLQHTLLIRLQYKMFVGRSLSCRIIEAVRGRAHRVDTAPSCS